MEVTCAPSYDRICCRSRIDSGTGETSEVHRSWLESRSLPSGRCSHRRFHSEEGNGHADQTVGGRGGPDPTGGRWFAAWRACGDWGETVLPDSGSDGGRGT